MRICHLADLHIGYSHLNQRTQDGQNQRQADFEHAALACADYVVDNDIDLVVISGDLLHETNLYPAAMRGAVNFCKKISEKNIPIICIGGNHDEVEGTGRYSGLKFLAEQTGMQLYLNQDFLDIQEARLHLVSYRVLSRVKRNKEVLKPFSFSTDKNNILVAHGYAGGEGVPEIPEDREVIISDKWLEDPRFSLVLLGHVHYHGEIKPHVFYAGSTERRNFGEVKEEPAFYVHEKKDEEWISTSIFIKDISNSSLIPRPMKQYDIDTLQLTTEEVNKKVLNLLEDTQKGELLRVRLQNVSPELDRSRARQNWQRVFRRNGGMHFEAITQTRRISEMMSVEFAKAPADIGEGLLSFLDNQQYINEQEEKDIKKLGAEIIAEAKEKVLQQDKD